MLMLVPVVGLRNNFAHQMEELKDLLPRINLMLKLIPLFFFLFVLS